MGASSSSATTRLITGTVGPMGVRGTIDTGVTGAVDTGVTGAVDTGVTGAVDTSVRAAVATSIRAAADTGVTGVTGVVGDTGVCVYSLAQVLANDNDVEWLRSFPLQKPRDLLNVMVTRYVPRNNRYIEIPHCLLTESRFIQLWKWYEELSWRNNDIYPAFYIHSVSNGSTPIHQLRRITSNPSELPDGHKDDNLQQLMPGALYAFVNNPVGFVNITRRLLTTTNKVHITVEYGSAGQPVSSLSVTDDVVLW